MAVSLIEKKYDSKKVRSFKIILYPVTESYDFKQLHKKIDKEFDWVRCLHDKDLKEDGTPCENHYHYVIRTKEFTCRRTSLSRFLGVDKYYITPIYGRPSDKDGNSLEDALLYLTHKNNPEKYQYMLSAVESKNHSRLYDEWWLLVNNEQDLEEGWEIDKIRYWIYSQKSYITMQDFTEFLQQNKLWRAYRKDRQTYHRMLDEKNMHTHTGADMADYLPRHGNRLPITTEKLNIDNLN